MACGEPRQALWRCFINKKEISNEINNEFSFMLLRKMWKSK